jgi:hypothetical protein
LETTHKLPFKETSAPTNNREFILISSLLTTIPVKEGDNKGA